MKQMKVCHITTVHKENDNRIFYKECASLRDHGFKVYLICSGVESKIKEGISIIGLRRYRNRVLHFFAVSLFGVIKKSLKTKAKIYHFHDPELIISGLILRMFGKKVIYDIHENNPASILSKPYIKSGFIKKVISVSLDITEKMSAPLFTKIVTARPDISERFKSLDPITLRNFPILRKEELTKNLAINKTCDVVMYVGGITKIRGISQLIRSFESLNDVELWLLGPWESKEYEEECKELPGWNKTRHLGIVEPFEIFSYMSYADIGIVTFLPYPNHIRTMATKPFEYMMTGLPMIMSNFPYWQELFEGLSEFVDPGNPDEIASVIRNLLNDREKRQQMSEQGRQRVEEEFNWQAESSRLITFYDKLVSYMINDHR